MALTDIQKPSSQEKEQFLVAMLNTLEKYSCRLSELENKYDHIDCSLISPCYFNFRDALFHYEKAYHSQETIQLYCEDNAMREHLHRALKDGCIKYLQILNERLDILYQYSCTPERYAMLSDLAEKTCLKLEKTLTELADYGLNINRLGKDLPKDISDREYWLLCEYLYYINYYIIPGKRKNLQKCIHALRNLEMDTRNDSMRIIQPFSVETDSSLGKAPIDSFFEKCDSEVSNLEKEGLLDFIICGRILLTSQTLESAE